jgi:hypothetical protein
MTGHENEVIEDGLEGYQDCLLRMAESIRGRKQLVLEPDQIEKSFMKAPEAVKAYFAKVGPGAEFGTLFTARPLPRCFTRDLIKLCSIDWWRCDCYPHCVRRYVVKKLVKFLPKNERPWIMGKKPRNEFGHHLPVNYEAIGPHTPLPEDRRKFFKLFLVKEGISAEPAAPSEITTLSNGNH